VTKYTATSSIADIYDRAFATLTDQLFREVDDIIMSFTRDWTRIDSGPIDFPSGLSTERSKSFGGKVLRYKFEDAEVTVMFNGAGRKLRFAVNGKVHPTDKATVANLVAAVEVAVGLLHAK